MKAKTQAAKRRGRPKLTVAFREPSGRPSRAKDPIDKLALEVRARMLGISLIDAKNPEAENYLGLLHMAHINWKQAKDKSEKQGVKFDRPQPEESISTAQYYAALQYAELHNDNAKAVLSPGAYYETFNTGSGDDDAHTRWATAAVAKWDAARKAIQAAQNETNTENLWAALDLIVLRGQRLPHMVGAVRTLANALNRHFRKEA